MDARVVQLNISPGGMPKIPVPRVQVSQAGLDGDWQLNRKYHGGPDRAVCLFNVELYRWLRDDHDIDLAFGSVGENFTTEGVDLLALKPGDRLSVGPCSIEITKVRVPCKNLNHWHPQLMETIKGRSGWMAKVIQPGLVTVGDLIALL